MYLVIRHRALLPRLLDRGPGRIDCRVTLLGFNSAAARRLVGLLGMHRSSRPQETFGDAWSMRDLPANASNAARESVSLASNRIDAYIMHREECTRGGRRAASFIASYSWIEREQQQDKRRTEDSWASRGVHSRRQDGT